MKKTSVLLLLLFSMSALGALAAPAKKFPGLDEQLRKAHARPGSVLEKLIRAHQDFSKLKDRDADDKIVPPWLKVYWRNGHPEGHYDNSEDPTGGYPFALKEVLEWMETHQDLRPGEPDTEEDEREDGLRPIARIAANDLASGTNVRASGAQAVSRSESDIRVNYWDPLKIIAASNNVSGSGALGMYSSSDGGVTWGQTTLPLGSGDSFHCDPTVDWSSDGIAWSTTIGINSTSTVLQVRSYRSTDGGATWVYDGTVSGAQTGADKQMQWIDHSATSPYKDHNYVIWHGGNPAYMNRRTSAGWGTPIQVSGTETTGTALGGDVKTNASGDVFGFYPDTGSRGIYVVKSTNGGASYSTPARIVTTYGSADIGVPAFNNRRSLVYVSGGAYRNGTTDNVYALWADLSGDTGCTTATNEPGAGTTSPCKTRVFFSRSTDGGATWSARVKINNQSGLNDQFNPFLAVDETNGNLGAIYYDTVADAGRRKVDVYYQLSTDGGATWQPAVKVTTAMTDESISGASAYQFGDYNGLSGYGNAFFPSWTDRRNNAREEIWTAKISLTSTPSYLISGSAGTSGATLIAGSASTTSDASNNYTLAGLAAGTYTVTPSKPGCTFSPSSSPVTLTSGNVTVNFTASCGPGDPQLTSGVPLTGESVAQGAWRYYSIAVPAGATNLTFATTAATSDVDIYTQLNAKPASSAYICRPYTASGNETCSATNPPSGTWWLGVYGYTAGSYTVTATVTIPVPTYSISGSAGTASATISAGSASATSDASNNYTIAGLANGTYTVTPSKSGCSFSPASLPVTIAGATVTGQNFTATCSISTTLFTNGFDNSTGWMVVDVSGTAGNWTFVTSGMLPTSTPHGGTGMAKFNSYDAASGSQTRVYRTTGFAIPTSATTATLKFWMYHDTGYSTYLDRLQVQASTNSTWTNVSTPINRYDGTTGWKQHTIDLTPYKGTTIRLGFLGISARGNNEFLDDVSVTTP